LTLITIFNLTADPIYNHYKQGEIVCKLNPGQNIGEINAAYGTNIKGYQPQTDFYLLDIPPEQDPENLSTIINNDPRVLSCSPNYFLNTPEGLQRSQPFLEVKTGELDEQPAALTLDLVTVQTVTTGAGARVAVIDGGVNFTHPEFALYPGALVSRWDYIDSDAYAFDEPGGVSSGHGTFVAGITRMVAPESDIYVYRVLDTTGQGDGYSVSEAVLLAVEDSCDVINLSLGMVNVNVALDEALKLARQNDIMIIAAAGNDSTDDNSVFPFPASRTYSVTVTALDSLNIKADFANYGLRINVCAPGTHIIAPYLDTLYASWEGTSFAAPFVTGLAALLRAKNPDMLADSIESLIYKTAESVDSLNPEYEGLLGSGLIDPMAALNYVPPLMVGDLNNDNNIDITDIVYLIIFLYLDPTIPDPGQKADTNCDGVIDISDITNIIGFLYLDGSDLCTVK